MEVLVIKGLIHSVKKKKFMPGLRMRNENIKKEKQAKLNF